MNISPSLPLSIHLSLLPSLLLSSFLPSFLPSILPSIHPSILPSFFLSFLPCFLPSILPSFHPFFLPPTHPFLSRLPFNSTLLLPLLDLLSVSFIRDFFIYFHVPLSIHHRSTFTSPTHLPSFLYLLHPSISPYTYFLYLLLHSFLH